MFRTVQFMNHAENPEHRAQVIPWLIDHDFLNFFDIAVVAGRGFIEGSAEDLFETPTDEKPLTRAGFMLNESAARAMGWTPQEAVGQHIHWEQRRPVGSVPETLPVEGPVVGVVEDFIYESITEPVKPLILMYGDEAPLVLVRAGAGELPAALAHIDRTWRSLWPDQPVNSVQLDTDFRNFHQSYFQQSELISYFALVAISLACFGLFGLAAFNAERRGKEVGVRKVMGGSVWSIVVLLTNDFSRLVLIANVIAWPIAWVAMDRWLESFAYRIDLSPMIFIGSGLIALCVAWATVGGTALRSANAKPVLALRYE